MTYSIERHRHIFSSWAASRAASVLGCRFKVVIGKEVLEKSGLMVVAENIKNLPSPKKFDDTHKKWREEVIKQAGYHDLTFSHGVAAKLINVYLKSVYLCGSNSEDPKVKAIHPPVDRLLLDELYKGNVAGKKSEWGAVRKIGWSKLDCKQYQS